MDFDSKWDSKIWELLAFLRPFSVLGAIWVPEGAKSVPGTSRSSFFGNFWMVFDDFRKYFFWNFAASELNCLMSLTMYFIDFQWLVQLHCLRTSVCLLQVIFSCTSVFAASELDCLMRLSICFIYFQWLVTM